MSRWVKPDGAMRRSDEKPEGRVYQSGSGL